MGTPVTPSDIEARAFLTTPGRQAAGFAEHTVPVLTPVTFVLSFLLWAWTLVKSDKKHMRFSVCYKAV
jgi:asparagine N-glycosylation enzyme membrane subunit Stt3